MNPFRRPTPAEAATESRMAAQPAVKNRRSLTPGPSPARRTGRRGEPLRPPAERKRRGGEDPRAARGHPSRQEGVGSAAPDADLLEHRIVEPLRDGGPQRAPEPGLERDREAHLVPARPRRGRQAVAEEAPEELARRADRALRGERDRTGPRGDH